MCFLITLYDIEDVLYASLDGVHLRLCLTILKAQLLSLHLSLGELLLQLLESLLPLVVGADALPAIPVNLSLHLVDLGLEVLNFITELINKLEQCKVLLFCLNEILDKYVYVMYSCCCFYLCKCLFIRYCLL